MPNTTNKRKAWSVQDTISGRSQEPQSRFKSGYGGPRKSAPELYDEDYAEVGGKSGKIRKSGYSGPRVTQEDPDRTGRIPTRSDRTRGKSGSGFAERVSQSKGSGYAPMASAAVQRGGYRAPRSGGLMDYSWAVFAGILVVCLIVAMIGYSKSINNVNGYRCPTYMLTMHGIINDIHEEYVSGGLGSRYRASNLEPTEEQKAGMLGDTEGSSSSTPNTTTGATMALDAGTADTSYGSMGSHEELLTALDAALAAGDSAFVGSKLCYQEEEGGTLLGYPQSVVEIFTTYMKDNADKRANFIAEVKSEDHSARNGDAYLVKIPLLKFTINMGTDNTTLSISGFSPLSMNAGQTAVVSPILPCMYSIDAQTDGKASHIDVPASMSEGNLQISIGSKQ